MSTDYYGSKSSIHLLLQISTIMAGLTYGSMALFMKFLGVQIGKASNFYKSQKIYGKAIDVFFNDHIAKVKNDMSAATSLTCMMDVRYDTPGNLYNW